MRRTREQISQYLDDLSTAQELLQTKQRELLQSVVEHSDREGQLRSEVDVLSARVMAILEKLQHIFDQQR